MNKRNKIQEDTYQSPFDMYKDEVNYDIIVEGTIGFEVVGLENRPTPDEEQIQDGTHEIFEQLEELTKDRDYIDDAFGQDGVAKGQSYMEFTDQEINNDKLYFKVGISRKGQTKDIKAQDIADCLAQIMEDLDINTDAVSVLGWQNEEESVEPTYVKLKLIGKPETKILKDDTLTESVNDDNTEKYKLVLYSKIGNEFKPDVFVNISPFDGNILVADNSKEAQSYADTDKEVNSIINRFESVPENKKRYEIRMIPEKEAEQFEKENMEESNSIADIDRKLVMEGKLEFIKENNIKSIILNDDGIMELYENNKLIDSKPFSKLGVQRECKSIIQEGFSSFIKLSEDTKADEIKDSKGDNIDLDQTKQNIEQSIEKVDELQDLKDELQNKVDNLYNESKIEEEKIDKFISTPFTQKLLNSEEIYNLKPEEELTVEQVAYITNLFGSLDDFMDSLKQLTEMVALSPDIHFISIDEYVQEMEKEFNKGVK